MALQIQCPKMRTTIGEVSFPVMGYPSGWRTQTQVSFVGSNRALNSRISALSGGDGSGSNKKAAAPNSNYVVPFDKSSCITRPLVEILRDLNKRMPDNIIKTNDDHSTSIPWYQANRMLSFYAPGKLLAQPQFELCVDEATQVWTFLNGGWCGEIRDVIFSENGSVTVVYRVTVRGSDGEAHRESTGTVLSGNGSIIDPVAAAEEIAFCRACARFGLGLYLYHED